MDSTFYLLTLLVALFQFFHTAMAEICHNGRYCGGNSYCCVDRFKHKCCGSPLPYHFWAQWYLWVAFVVFFVLLFSCLMAYRRRQRHRLGYNRNNITTVTTTTTTRQVQQPRVVAAGYPAYPQPFVSQNRVPDAPPTYEQVTSQVSGPQTGEYPKNYILPTGPAPEYKDPNYPPYPIQHPVASSQSPDPPVPPYPGN